MSTTDSVLLRAFTLIGKGTFDKEIKISEARGNAYHQKQGGKDVIRSQLSVKVHTEHEGAKDRDNHGKTKARGISHLEQYLLFVGFTHRRTAYSILAVRSQ
jgi:hypothetical protein